MKIELIKILNKIKNYTINFFGSLSKKESSSLKSILEDHVDHRREFSASEKNMLINIVGFGESRVEDSMVPRADIIAVDIKTCLLYTSPSPRDATLSRMPSSA